MTISRPGRVAGRVSGELCEEAGTLAFAQPAQSAVVGDVVLLHQTLRLHLAGPRHGGEERLHLDPTDQLVFFGPLEELGESERPCLQQLLRLGTHTAGFGRLGEGGSTLLICQLLWLHRSSLERTAPTVSGRLRWCGTSRVPIGAMTTYFISGASSGLGAEMARRLVRRGDAVAISARRHDLLEALAAELSANGGLVTVHPADVRDLDQVRRAILEADERHGGLDVVVANAGRGGGGRIGTGRWRENREVIETNLLGTLNQAEVAMELFRRREGGHLVLVSSLASVRGLPG